FGQLAFDHQITKSAEEPQKSRRFGSATRRPLITGTFSQGTGQYLSNQSLCLMLAQPGPPPPMSLQQPLLLRGRGRRILLVQRVATVDQMAGLPFRQIPQHLEAITAQGHELFLRRHVVMPRFRGPVVPEAGQLQPRRFLPCLPPLQKSKTGSEGGNNQLPPLLPDDLANVPAFAILHESTK